MAKDWISTGQNLPEIGSSIIASVRDGNSYYSEFLVLEKDGSWSYQNGQKLEETKKVVGWMDGPPTFIA